MDTIGSNWLAVAIDDTDSVDEGATGKLAELIAVELAKRGVVTGITRHQLFVHELIRYTSHNSAMAFMVREVSAGEVFDTSSRILEENSVDGSDPGLCIVSVSDEETKRDLIDFGRRAKRCVLRKDEAMRIAQKHRETISLTAHGGDGSGVIGALAGAGLRISGNDGRFRGWLDLEGEIKVKELLKRVDEVRSPTGSLEPDEVVLIEGRAKAVLLGGMSVLLVRMEGGVWRNLSREEVKRY